MEQYAIEDNAADDALMVDQGHHEILTSCYQNDLMLILKRKEEHYKDSIPPTEVIVWQPISQP